MYYNSKLHLGRKYPMDSTKLKKLVLKAFDQLRTYHFDPLQTWVFQSFYRFETSQSITWAHVKQIAGQTTFEIVMCVGQQIPSLISIGRLCMCIICRHLSDSVFVYSFLILACLIHELRTNVKVTMLIQYCIWINEQIVNE